MSSSNDDEITLDDCRKIFEGFSETSDDTTWLVAARDKIYSILRSPVKEEFTHEAFKWVAQLCISLEDFSWISSKKRWTLEEAKMLSCIVLLSFNEIQILLPLIQRHLISGDEIDLEGGKVLARPASSQEYDRYGDHLVILENYIRFLVKNEDDSEETSHQYLDAFSSNERRNLLDRLKEVIVQLGDYLELVHKNWSTLIEEGKESSEKFSSAEGTLRVICVWLSEEPELFKAQCKSFLIDLILKNLLLDDKSMQADILVLALHSICTYVSDDNELLNVLRQHPQHKEALEKYLKYVEKERSKVEKSETVRHLEKKFKLRCGLVKDLMVCDNKSLNP